jgi:molybdopterin-guanine dinucleotide biosynthesis protein A
VDKNGKIKVCDCDPDESPYPSCDECPWSDEELAERIRREREKARSMMGNRNVKKNAELHLRLPKELYEKLKELAERDERTMSYIIRKALKEYLEKLENLERKEVG